MGEAFDNLALAATAKQSTMDQMVKAIADLTDANARLTKASQTLAQQLKKAMDGNSGGQRSTPPPPTLKGPNNSHPGRTRMHTATHVGINSASGTSVQHAQKQRTIPGTKRTQPEPTYWVEV